jgi:hypothetical protein
VEAEVVAALAGTVFAGILLVLTASFAGPLWRDEINSINMAQMPSLHEMWLNMTFESFPPLWLLLLRVCGWVGLAGSDASIRVLGLYVGLFFLISLWLSARWLGSRAPIMSVALLGGLPAFIFIVGANRAYGLASGLLVLSFGLIWRVVEAPSRARIFWAGLASFLFAHCVYYDVIFLCAMLGGGAVVVIRRRQWKTLVALVVIGFISSVSLAIYAPVVLRGSTYGSTIPLPNFSAAILWERFGDAVTARSSADLGQNGPEVWLWIGLVLAGTAAALAIQRTRAGQTSSLGPAAGAGSPARADRAVFCAVSMLIGVVGLFAFLYRIHYLTQAWYYVELLCLCTIALDGLWGANWPALRPWGWLRIGFLVLMMCWCARPAWKEAHTRRTTMDLIATTLDKGASEQDLIVVQTCWEAISFDRYYHGRTPWMSVPPIDSHKVHRSDLVYAMMNQPDAMVSVLTGVTNTLRSGHSVWLVGNMIGLPPDPPPTNQAVKWAGTYYIYWNEQLSSVLLQRARQEQVVEMPVDMPICCLENLPLVRFSGYKSGTNDSTEQK